MLVGTFIMEKQYVCFSNKIIIELPYDPEIQPLDIYPKDLKSWFSKRYLHSYVHHNIIHNSQDMETM